MGQEIESLQARHIFYLVGIAQLVRALDCGSRGHRFYSDYPPHYILGCSQVGKARHFDCRMRRFESCQPSQIFWKIKYGPLAQLAEHLTFNQGVRSSNLRWITKIDKIHCESCRFYILQKVKTLNLWFLNLSLRLWKVWKLQNNKRNIKKT